MKNIQLLDCTLRDGAYVVDAQFGASAIKGIIKRLQESKVDIIECGWLKDTPHEVGTSFYHVPDDLLQYMITPKSPNSLYVAMIDYNRYDINNLPECDGKTIDAIRVVFPKDKVDEGLALAEPIRKKGYKVFFQAANTLGYSDQEILSLITKVNAIKPEAISIVDTFGAMYSDDLARIVSLFDHNLDHSIMIGLHSHNNLQLSFALAIQFINMLAFTKRRIVVDSSLCGMGRGAGNANTELVANYLNDNFSANYDLNTIMDTIDIYMTQYLNKYQWGYSTPYFVSGIYCSHVNNIAYLIKNHKTKSRDLKNIIEALDEKTRLIYDYDNLEKTYVEYMTKEIDDSSALQKLSEKLAEKKIALIAPGKSSYIQTEHIDKIINDNNCVVIGINSVIPEYSYDYLFFSNPMRFDYAKESNPEIMACTPLIVSSNISCEDAAYQINYNDLIKRGWKYFDNSLFLCLRLLDRLNVNEIFISGFDGYETGENYTDSNMEIGLTTEEMNEFNSDLLDMMKNFKETTKNHLKLTFVTKSRFDI